MYFFRKLSLLIIFFAEIRSEGVLIENVFVGISNVPILKLFSRALNSSIPSILSRLEGFSFPKLFKASGLKEIISR